jgi:hypothetical protein
MSTIWKATNMAAHRIYPWFSAALISAAFIAYCGGLEAQRGRGGPGGQLAVAVGPRVGGNWDETIWSVGGQARITLPFFDGIQLSPSADVFLLDGDNEWQANLDVVLQLLPIVYGGAGLAMARDSLPTSEGPTTETGYNLFLGATIPTLRFPLKPFVEVRWTEINRLVKPRRVVVGFDLPLTGRAYSRRR